MHFKIKTDKFEFEFTEEGCFTDNSQKNVEKLINNLESLCKTLDFEKPTPANTYHPFGNILCKSNGTDTINSFGITGSSSSSVHVHRFEPSTKSSSATICAICGKEKHEHIYTYPNNL
jgi:hypothetical protein